MKASNRLNGPGLWETAVEKSKFIAYTRPVADREEALAFFDEIRGLHRDATHHVPAYALGQDGSTLWASDDGEPQGTAGAPILNLLAGNGLTECAVMVVRYFGGVKLGPGGLLRAYTAAARGALEDAGMHPAAERTTWTLEVDYPYLSKLEAMASEGWFELAEADYGEKVVLTIEFPQGSRGDLWDRVRDLTSGSVKILTEVTKTT